MSGIIGLVNNRNEPIDLSLLRKMTDSMIFRGPDDQRTWSSENVGLGQTLLRTTHEQEYEQQPFTIDDRVWIVGDIRLDGRKDLIAALQSKVQGILADVPDIELVLQAYYIWDSACVEHLQGDFAFIIWDGRQQKLFCGRDQFGIVPFYYAQINNTLICSNTLNCIRLHPKISTKLNEQVVGDFLLWGMNMEWSPTIFQDIQRLPPAHTLTWQVGQIQIRQYWQLRPQALIFYKHPQEYLDHFSTLFEQAVGDRMRTNRITTHLSGGMDSTSIAATAKKILLERDEPFDLHAFTTRDRRIMPEEDSYASMVAHYIGIPLTDVHLENYADYIPPEKPNMLFPEPIDIPTSPSHAFTQRSATHSRIILTGLGGDPALRLGEFYWLEWWRQGLRREIFLVEWHHLLTHHLPKLYLRPRLSYIWHIWHRKIKSKDLTLPIWINTNYARRLNLQSRYAALNNESIGDIGRYGMAHRSFWSSLFEQYDPGVTGVAVKHYHPFFDLRLVNFLISIPPVPWLVDKYLLRQSMKGKLPEAILNRPKTVFDMPDENKKAQREAVEIWIGDLLKNTPGLENYVDISEVLKVIKSAEFNTLTSLELNATLAVAYWLRNYQDMPLGATHPKALLC
jgi:asparagine synthase (glutamine-hydrolysing)